jgi:hypothetical protein
LQSSFLLVADRHQATLDFFSAPSHEQVVRTPSVISYKEGQASEFEEREEEKNVTEQLHDFVLSERFPRFVKVSRINFQQLLGTRKFIVIVVAEEDKLGNVQDEIASKLIQLFREFAYKHHDRVKR